jgi:pimeloyl-ACP methyl ester carboxylesterase
MKYETALGRLMRCLLLLGPLLTGARAMAGDCGDLGRRSIAASQLGMPTRGAAIDSATLDTGHPDQPVCVVKGKILPRTRTSPDIVFQVNLPQHWNGKAVHVGGGGFNGILTDGRHVPYLPSQEPLPAGNPPSASVDITARGYATFGSDGGHQWDGTKDLLAFAMDDEALRNYGGDQLKKVHDVAVELMRLHYGRSPRHIYFFGGSKGGQEALAVAQRWPDDYDGIVVIHPGYDFMAEFLGVFHLVRNPVIARLNEADFNLLAHAVLATCDSLDGLADGIIADVAGCRTRFDPRALTCGPSKPSPCISPEHMQGVVELLRPIEFGFSLGGVSEFSSGPILEGASAPDMLSLNDRRPLTRSALVEQTLRYMVLRNPRAEVADFRPKEHIPRLRQLSLLLDANSPNLDEFRRHGGKLLLMQGTTDMVVPPANSIAYYDKLRRRYDGSLHDFVRFYVIPGFGHGSGPFLPRWDALSTLDRWVRFGLPPGLQTISDAVPEHRSRSRPLCEYPSWARYVSGNPDDARSFKCVE